MRILVEFARLILILLLLPVILILLGPLLVWTALRGRQPVGPITLDLSRYGAGARVGALGLGLLLWLLVWGGLGWFITSAFGVPVNIAQVWSTPATATPEPTLTATPNLKASPTRTSTPPAASQAVATASPTRQVKAAANTATPTATALITLPTLTPSATSFLASAPDEEETVTATATTALSPTPRPTTLPPTATPSPARPTATATPTVTPTPPPATATPKAKAEATATSALEPTTESGLSAPERRASLTAIRNGNNLLHDAIMEANEENLKNLASIWEGQALTEARAFVTRLNKQYTPPLKVEFEYLSPPAIENQLADNRLVIISQERWSYGDPTKIEKQETFNFVYTLTRRNNRWVISEYNYLNLPATATPTRTPRPTSTPTVTP